MSLNTLTMKQEYDLKVFSQLQCMLKRGDYLFIFVTVCKKLSLECNSRNNTDCVEERKLEKSAWSTNWKSNLLFTFLCFLISWNILYLIRIYVKREYDIKLPLIIGFLKKKHFFFLVVKRLFRFWRSVSGSWI